MNKKKLVLAIGPALLAFLTIGFIFYSPFNLVKQPSAKAVHESASSMSLNVLKGNALRKEAMFSNDYLPFFGSSELSRVNRFHPSVLAKKYNRDYEPYLLGAPGTQSLKHFFLMNSMKDELKGKKAVFIISPQWFVKDGVGDSMFSLYFSPLDANGWLTHADSQDVNDQYLASRLLNFSSVDKNNALKKMVTKISNGQPLAKFDIKKLSFKNNMLNKEDLLFSPFTISSKSKKINEQVKLLPDNYLYDELDTLAIKIGEEQTDNNEFDISNHFYTTRIMPVKSTLKNSQKKFDYVSSPEFSDFQLVLNQIAKNHMDVLFVIPPVNKRWSDYTGLSQNMLETFSKKINYQLTSQGFNHISDYTDKNADPYFMEDTIHLGWRGWLNLDKDLQEFLSDTSTPHYQLDPKTFLSDTWQTETETKK